ncbi:hypothetical protein NKG94_19320 [Micromonospora sp. M12]
MPLATYDSRGLSAFYVVFGVTLSSFVLAQGSPLPPRRSASATASTRWADSPS